MSTENDLSDEAYLEWMSQHVSAVYPRDAWQECRRRAEALIETERREARGLGFREGYEFSCTPEGETRTFQEAKKAYLAYTEKQQKQL